MSTIISLTFFWPVRKQVCADRPIYWRAPVTILLWSLLITMFMLVVYPHQWSWLYYDKRKRYSMSYKSPAVSVFFFVRRHISVTVPPIGVIVYTMAELCPRTSFSLLVAISLGLIKCEVKKGALCILRTLCRHVTIGTPIVIFAVLTVFWVFLTVFEDWYTVGTVLVDLWRLVRRWFWLFLTIGTVYQSSKSQKSQKTVKTAKMIIGVPIVTCLPRLYQ